MDSIGAGRALYGAFAESERNIAKSRHYNDFWLIVAWQTLCAEACGMKGLSPHGIM